MNELGSMKNGKISKFYEQQTGRSAKQGTERVQKIKQYLINNDLTLEQIKLEKHNDRVWNTRQNRTKKEQKAEIIGYTNHKYHGYLVEMWWIIPKNNK